jgi:proteasome beta subunit
LKKLFREDFTETDAVLATVQALYDAADEDSATGGPDLTRRIYPVITTVTADGFRRLSDDETAAVTEQVVTERMSNPGGPQAPLR